MRRTDELILAARRATDNIQVDTSYGISDDIFVNHLNEGLHELNALMALKNCDNLQVQVTQALSADTESYTLPADCYSDRYVISVEYSHNSDVKNYCPLQWIHHLDRDTSTSTSPSFYFVRNGSVYVNPVPKTARGSIRITYIKRLNSLDIRRGKIASTTDDATNYLTVTFSSSDPVPDSQGWDLITQACAVNAFGAQSYVDLKVASWDEGTRTITLEAGQLMSAGTLTTGEWMVFGERVSTHVDSEVTRFGEDYLVAYAVHEIFKHDDLVDSVESLQKLAKIEARLVEALTAPSYESQFWPISDAELLDG